MLAALGLALASGCRRAAPPPPLAEVVLVSAATVPSDPSDAAWQTAPEFIAKLLTQDLVEPRLMQASTPEVRVRAVTDGREVAFRLQWADPQADDLPGTGRFCDACAVQLPAKIEPTVPAPQMGETGRAVEITYWSAAWQAIVDGRGDSIRDIYPNASIDHYPFQAAPLANDPAARQAMAARYAPARALGNPAGGPRKTPVEDLIAEGPGTLAPAPSGESRGEGKHGPAGWTVVIVRRMPDALVKQPRGQIALAVWEGSRHEAGARKMRTAWTPMVVQAKP